RRFCERDDLYHGRARCSMALMLASGIGMALVLIFVGIDRYMRTDDPAFENRLRRYAMRQGGVADVAGDARGAAMSSAMSERVGRAARPADSMRSTTSSPIPSYSWATRSGRA